VHGSASQPTGIVILLKCERPISVRFAPVTKPVAGCLRG